MLIYFMFSGHSVQFIDIPIGKCDTIVGNTLFLFLSLPNFTRIDNLRVYAEKFPEMLRFDNFQF